MQQNYAFHDVPLNQINTTNNDTIDGHSIDSTFYVTHSDSALHRLHPDNNASTTRSMFTKSLSMTSSTSTVTVPSNEILSNLDDRQCLSGLEFTLTLLATQSLLALKDVNLSTREKQLIKRELSTELAVYHDFVRKRISCESKGLLYRKKRGIVPIRLGNDDGGSNFQAHPSASTITKDRIPVRQQQSMRVSVTRKMHHITTAAQTPPIAAPSLKRTTISPIVGSEEREISTPKKLGFDIPSSTPMEPVTVSTPNTRVTLKPHHSKRVSFPDDLSAGGKRRTSASEDFVLNQDESNEQTYTGLSMVQLVESDYLHFLANVFTYICQTLNE